MSVFTVTEQQEYYPSPEFAQALQVFPTYEEALEAFERKDPRRGGEYVCLTELIPGQGPLLRNAVRVGWNGSKQTVCPVDVVEVYDIRAPVVPYE